MIRRPHLEDLRIIGHYTGIIMNGLGLLMLLPLATALVSGEWAVAIDFVISMAVAFIVGYGLLLICHARRHDLTWMQGMVVAALSYLVGMVLAAVPYALSGHWKSFLDASFDTMSGFTTTGLTLVNDLDHLSRGINMWRHLLSYLGGQGMVVLALTFLLHDAAGAFKLYVGEAKDERLLPNVVHTARAIWFISLVYLGVGTLMLWLAGLWIGIQPVSSFYHALWVFMAGWSTGGFAPESQNILYYHSFLYEAVIILFMVVGSFNFGLHYAVWTGRRDEILKNIETIFFALTTTLLAAVTIAGLARSGTYGDAISLFRKGYFMLISGHTGTGYQTVYARQFVHEWGDVAIMALIAAMLFGGSAVSTAGGFKALRIGILVKTVGQEIRRLLAPETAVIVTKYHYMREVVMEDATVRSALLVILFYLITWGLGSMAGMISGYPMRESLFEAASAMGNVGLSTGVTAPAMPAFLKSTYIFVMWAGRMEFMALLALVGFVWAGVRGR
ncbi:MAG: TrkH family potassium uptake protein [Symbiobacteriia bacterium]